jgi:acetyltransferase-like isoleucine patch superfamily enzyme
MLAGELRLPGDAEIQADLGATKQWLVRFNASLAQSPVERREILLERIGAVGNGTVIWPPFFCDYGYNIRLGDGFFLNYKCVFLDVVTIAVGDRTQIGPAVQIYSADHPRDPGRQPVTALRLLPCSCRWRGKPDFDDLAVHKRLPGQLEEERAVADYCDQMLRAL